MAKSGVFMVGGERGSGAMAMRGAMGIGPRVVQWPRL